MTLLKTADKTLQDVFGNKDWYMCIYQETVFMLNVPAPNFARPSVRTADCGVDCATPQFTLRPLFYQIRSAWSMNQG